MQLAAEQLKRNRRQKWSRHLRVIDAKDQGATHAEVFLQLVDDGWESESSKSQPSALVSQWHKQAIDIMEKAARFL
jgi:hypothetical protein